MKTRFSRWAAVTLAAACIASSVGCYPAYPPANSEYAYSQDSKGYSVPQQHPPRYVGVDPGLVVAGVAAAGLLGYALGNHHGYHHHGYCGPAYYRPAYYGHGYYGPRYCH